ncbi:hypothetical protein LUZ60_005716 [Juncus effusus]|nr:hypothetical protein LUZ60_005716 [Juncus effusus]
MEFHLHHESKSSSHPLILILVLFFAPHASAQFDFSQPPAPPPKTLPVQTVVLLLVAMLLILFFIFYMAYVKQCIDRNIPTASAATTSSGGNGNNNANPSRPRGSKGVEQSVIENFPTIDYSAVKNLRTSKCPLECAICLSEFENDDTLRVLPGCRHVFHPECIDTWLTDHATCPVCRSNLADPTVLAGKRLLSMNLDSETFTSGSHSSEQEATSHDIEVATFGQVRRSHSVTEGWERYTLRLSDEVLKQIEMTGRKHRRSVSVQDYTYHGKASWRDGRLWAVLRSISTPKNHRREDQTVSEGIEEPSDSARSSRRLIGHSRRVESEISGVGSARIEMGLNDLPVCNRV